MFLDGFCQLLVSAVVFVLGEPVGQLAHIQHRYLFALPSSVHAEGQIAQLAVGQPDKCVAGGADMSSLSHLHGEVFQFWQAGILIALRFEDILAPEPYDGEFGWLVFSTTIHVERHFGLNTGYGCTGADDLSGQFRHVVSRVRKNGCRIATEELTGASGMIIHLTIFQFLITIQALTHSSMVLH